SETFRPSATRRLMAAQTERVPGSVKCLLSRRATACAAMCPCVMTRPSSHCSASGTDRGFSPGMTPRSSTLATPLGLHFVGLLAEQRRQFGRLLVCPLVRLLVRRVAFSGSQIGHCADAVVVPVAHYGVDVRNASDVLSQRFVNGSTHNVSGHLQIVKPKLEPVQHAWAEHAASNIPVVVGHFLHFRVRAKFRTDINRKERGRTVILSFSNFFLFFYFLYGFRFRTSAVRFRNWCGPFSELVWSVIGAGVVRIRNWCGPIAELVWSVIGTGVVRIRSWCGPFTELVWSDFGTGVVRYRNWRIIVWSDFGTGCSRWFGIGTCNVPTLVFAPVDDADSLPLTLGDESFDVPVFFQIFECLRYRLPSHMSVRTVAAIPSDHAIGDPRLTRPKSDLGLVFVRYGQKNVQLDFERPIRHVKMAVRLELAVQFNPTAHDASSEKPSLPLKRYRVFLVPPMADLISRGGLLLGTVQE